jgi:hypothetical protein
MKDPGRRLPGAGYLWLRNNLVGLLALFVALSGTAVAAQVASNAHSNPAVKAAKKKRGPRGPQGPPGANGVNGTNGTDGTPATRLFAAVNGDCSSVSRSSGGVTVSIPAASQSRCDVTFPQNVSQCIPAVTLEQAGSAGELSAAGSQDGATVNDNQITVSYHNSAGTPITSSRQSFFIVVFC